MASRAKSRGSGSGCFVRFLGLVILGYLLISWIPRCAQQLPQMAANTAAGAAHGVTTAAGNAARSAGQRLLDRIKSLFGGMSPAEKFKLVCEHLPVEGVDKLCPYFTAPLDGATESQAAQTSCYLTAAASSSGGTQTLQSIYRACTQTFGDPSAFEGCVETYVKRDDTVIPTANWANCLTGSQQMFESEVHTLSEPIACIPGLPKSWCTTGSSSASATAPNPSPAMRTDANYLNCLQYYYLSPGVKAVLGASCGTQINSGNEACMAGQLQTYSYAGQNLGPQYLAYCAAQPQ